MSDSLQIDFCPGNGLFEASVKRALNVNRLPYALNKEGAGRIVLILDDRFEEPQKHVLSQLVMDNGELPCAVPLVLTCRRDEFRSEGWEFPTECLIEIEDLKDSNGKFSVEPLIRRLQGLWSLTGGNVERGAVRDWAIGNLRRQVGLDEQHHHPESGLESIVQRLGSVGLKGGPPPAGRMLRSTAAPVPNAAAGFPAEESGRLASIKDALEKIKGPLPQLFPVSLANFKTALRGLCDVLKVLEASHASVEPVSKPDIRSTLAELTEAYPRPPTSVI